MRNIIYQDWIIEPSSELIPSIHIAPLTFQSISEENNGRCLGKYLSQRYKYYQYTTKGREAIKIALEYFHLEKEDVVTILTTSGNFYISGCVTKEIEKICKWSRDFTDKTKVIFVNHEFGYAYKELAALKSYGLPIIEDCAHSFFTECNGIGTVGDFVIYSLPKAFSMQLGGVLVSNSIELIPKTDKGLNDYFEKYAGSQIQGIHSITEKRLDNYYFLESHLADIGIYPFFELEKGTVPGVFLFRWHSDIDYPKLKVFMQSHGVESSVFYGQDAFFIPCHQELSQGELNYMIELLRYFAKYEI